MSGSISPGDRELDIRALVPRDDCPRLEIHSHQAAAGARTVAGQRIRCAPRPARADVLPAVRGVDRLDGAVRWIEQPEADQPGRAVRLRREVDALGFVVDGDPRAVGRGCPGIERASGAGGRVGDMNRAVIDGRQVRVGKVLAVR